jgi:hypothetical protein
MPLKSPPKHPAANIKLIRLKKSFTAQLIPFAIDHDAGNSTFYTKPRPLRNAVFVILSAAKNLVF